MARKKLSEFTAKTLLTKELGLPYRGMGFTFSKDKKEVLDSLDATLSYVVKVDEGVKKRMKNGLVALDKKPRELFGEIEKLNKKGYTHFIIEPFVLHAAENEKYFSITRTREGLQILYSEKGGVAIEENQDSIRKFVIPASEPESIDFDLLDLRTPRGIYDLRGSDNILQKLIRAFNSHHFSFLEINPLVIENDAIYLLDVAAEVDDAGAFFVKDAWTAEDFRTGVKKEKTEQEKAVTQLVEKSQAAFSLEVLNPNGSIFMLLLGGGASIVLADEAYNRGYGRELANYGEASGNPNAEEVYLYAKNILQLLLQSKAKKKVLLIAGGAANFSDVRVLFKGLIKAIAEVKEQLLKQQVKVFVRRGGPYQEEGLAQMKHFLEKEGLYGLVAGPDLVLTQVVAEAIKEL